MSFNGNTINGNSINGAPSDYEGYQLWLRNPAKALVHLVEIDYHGASAVYPNWVTYTLKWSDQPFDGYQDRIKSIGSFSRQIGERFNGADVASLGEIEAYNNDGALDLFHSLALSGQRVRVRHGDASWPEDAFRTVFECIAETVPSSSQDTFKIRLRGIDYKANLPLQTNLLPTVGVTAGSSTPIPKAFGQPFNIEPAVIDSTNETRQFNDGPSTSVANVRDGGIPFQTPQRIISAVVGNLMSTAVPHGFVANTRIRSDIGTLPASTLWRGIAWNGSVFCAIVSGANTAAISPDGIAWTKTTPLTDFNSWHGIAWNGSVFCIVANSGECATSPDGITWTARTMPSASAWESVSWNGTVFCAIATGIGTVAATSPDGITWTARTLPSSMYWTKVAWNGTVFCAIGAATSITTTTTCATSPDGITWTARTMSSSQVWREIAWNGSVFCALGQGSAVAATSPDGITWTARTLPSSNRWWSLAWNGSVFCAVCLNGPAATSPDGITWTARTLPGSAFWGAIAWNGSVFCAVAYLNTYSTVSTDGIDWSAATGTLPTPLALSTDYWVVPDGLTTTDFKVSATRGGAVIPLTGTTTGGALIGYHWTADLTNSKLLLDSKPAGTLTADVIAGSTDASAIIVSVLGATNVDPASQRRFQVTCPQPIGLYVRERRNRLDIANEIISGLGAWYGYSREGMLLFGRVEGNPANYDFELTTEDIVPDTFVLDATVMPEKQHRLSYKKNYTSQDGKLFADVSADNRTLYSSDYSVSAPLTSADVGANGSFHALNVIPDVQESLMVLSADAAAENVRLDALFYGIGAVFACDVGLIGTQFEIGSVLKVTYPRFGLGAGVNMTVVKIEDKPTAGKVSLRMFVALANYTPGQL